MADWGDLADEQAKSLREKVAQVSINVSIEEPPTPPGQQSSAQERKTEQEPQAEEQVSQAEASLLTKILRSKLVDTGKGDVEVQRADPKSPLFSVKSFEDLRLRPELLQGVYGMGFNKPSRIQEVALPILIADPPQNLIAQSQSGTGKTAAFVLTMLTRIDGSKPYPQAICLSPTFDLALQTGAVLEQMGKFLPNIKFTYAVKGQRLERGQTVSEQIVVGTPGTVLDWILKKKALDPSKIVLFVLDEADIMIATQGHQDQTIRIHKTVNPNCQKALFSATYDEDVMRFAKSIIPNPVILRLKKEEQSLDNIKQFYVKCRNEEDKFQALANIYGTVSVGQAMVFCHTRKSANWLAAKMVKEGHAVGLLTGEMDTEQRVAVLDRFREGKEKVLITTNVMARGIDVEQVTIVVNYDLPYDVVLHRPDFETYLHRIGRTGRFGKSGLALNLVDGQRSYHNMQEIQKHFGRPILELQVDDPDAIEKAVGEN